MIKPEKEGGDESTSVGLGGKPRLRRKVRSLTPHYIVSIEPPSYQEVRLLWEAAVGTQEILGNSFAIGGG